jgi:NAD(P)-dependent dehydrogenase (short-subunit alcohol dehydrogenase family)
VPFLGPYNASKAAVESLSDALRRELLPFGVDVVVVQLGTTRTPLWDRARDADPTPFLDSDYLDALRKVQKKALKRSANGQPPAAAARAILRVLTAERPPTRVRVQRKRSARLRYRLLPLVPDRFIDRQVARRVWRR